jgi:pentatricopeptide repeat protein
MRSSSVSLSGTGRNERGEKMGVLKTVQLHTRSRHVFAPVETLASAKERLLAEAVDLGDVVSRPLLVRRNSTSAPLSPLLDAPKPIPLPVSPPEFDQDAEEVQVSFNPVEREAKFKRPTTQSVTPPPSENDYIATLLTCQDESSTSIVKDTIDRMLQDPSSQNVNHFNAGLRALHVTRRPGDPLTHIVRLYNAMLDKSVVPNVETYETLILALTARDYEVHHAILAIESKLKNDFPLFGRVETPVNVAIFKSRLNRLRLEDNFGSAMSLFEGVIAVKGTYSLYPGTFTQLIRSCAFHSNVSAAVHVFAQLERRRKPIDHPVYRNMIIAFSNVRMIKQAEEIFGEFLKPRFSVKSFPKSVDETYHLHSNRHEQIKVWNAMIEAYFRAEMPDKAVELLERMLASTAGDNFGPNDIPIITPSTFKVVLAGFFKSGDPSSALSWFERLLAQKESATSSYEGLGGAPTSEKKLANASGKECKLDCK